MQFEKHALKMIIIIMIVIINKTLIEKRNLIENYFQISEKLKILSKITINQTRSEFDKSKK